MREQEKTRRLKALGRLGQYRVEPETNQVVFDFACAETDRDGGSSLCDEIFAKANIECAIDKVRANNGALGVDGMTVSELEGWWSKHGADEERFIRNLYYRPSPVRKVEIPKPNGGMQCNVLCQAIDGWLRRRIRQYIWKQWKKVRTRIRKLKALGMDKDMAYQWACTRKGYWRISSSPFLQWALNNEYLRKLGRHRLIACLSDCA